MSHDPHHEDHGHSLAEDMKLMQAMVERRRALRLLAGAGTVALVAGCGGAGESSSGVGVVTGATPTPTPTPTPTSTPTPTPTSTATGSCIADPTETAGPYPADGANTSSGSTSNILTVSGIQRSDIRSSFISSTTVATGVQVVITLTLVNVNSACAALSGYAVYLWHCDRSGNYSLYSAPAESYLRGVQVTDANGQVTFTTIFPACYSGRWPHMHFEIFSSLSNALGGKYAILTSQLAMPAALCNTLFADTTTYPSSKTNFAQVSLSSDNVFGDNTAAQLTQQTPTFTAAATGYTATALIGIAR
ncbi:Intradiol ring-cleavage dioxygenase [Sphingomonas sp. EC-HK361]|uniref:dioxygenase family protein n=1 Tax=Sphingomonas sp. EC-HK361 TaxID=2038397 RepID=UPI001257F5CB|nr:intradiol ring-cleavage dioxygenase [Sphingomonas sp. EC-HK361]VVT00243.1 Intradiol ring-cleavage dioxygenase [Sphingomonas sp. EC-HK361]